MKKSLIIFLVVALPLLAISVSANANIFNKFRKGFYFEKYKTAEEAKAVLLEMHPVGSDVTGLVKTLKNSDMKCGPISNPKYKDKPEYKNLLYCDYYKSKFIVFSTEWRVLIKFDSANKNLIQSLEIHKFFHTL